MSDPTLGDPALAPLWAAVRDRLERRGLDNRGLLPVPDLDTGARLTLKNLVDRPRPPKRIDLGELETALVRLGVGADLPSALAALGHEASDEPARQRADRARRRAARKAVRAAAAMWPEAWATEWIEAVISTGVLADFGVDEAVELMVDTRRVLDTLTGGGDDGDVLDTSSDSLVVTAHGVSRVELAAKVLGDSHALDTGRPHHVAMVRALAFHHGLVDVAVETEVWNAAGIHPDLTSGPVLVWRLPVLGGLAPLVESATTAGVPLHLSRMALLDHPPDFEPGTDVLIVENPRIVEVAAQLGVATPMISAAGSPSTTVQMLTRRLLERGAVVRYHGDFDAAGIALCARMHAEGVVPWRMTAQDYLDALAAADAQGVELPVDANQSLETPWDRGLQDAFNAERRIVHEERLLPGLLGPDA